jgi:hypothetical protein
MQFFFENLVEKSAKPLILATSSFIINLKP